mmetsp:Transcript_24747/g.73240  ORF Transcript_24747/g.73240 Transcript_24747/m.73240 type:complete len:206 (-) Transcript_24747:285-902(-)
MRVSTPFHTASAQNVHLSRPLDGELGLLRFCRPLHVPRQSGHLEAADEVVAEVNLPPLQPVRCTVLKRVVVVVPPVAKHEQRHECVVAAVVARFVVAAAPHVHNAVDQPRHVHRQQDADHKAPHQVGHATKHKEKRGLAHLMVHVRRPDPAIKPGALLVEPGHGQAVLHVALCVLTRVGQLLVKQPAHVRVPKAVARRVAVGGRV